MSDDLELLYVAWTIIANVSEGDWSQQTDEWQRAAVRWRDQFHAAMHRDLPDQLAEDPL